jgi:hypothetical protein
MLFVNEYSNMSMACNDTDSVEDKRRSTLTKLI